MVYNKGNAMVSRSFRIDRDTLNILEKYSEEIGLGITVCIRTILKSFADNIVEDSK